MECYICKKEAEEKSKMYVEFVCLECEDRMMESHKKSEEFRKQYREAHAACPKCGGTSHYSTLAGYILDMSKPEAYQDKNECNCTQCGDKHIAHDRVPLSTK